MVTKAAVALLDRLNPGFLRCLNSYGQFRSRPDRGARGERGLFSPYALFTCWRAACAFSHRPGFSGGLLVLPSRFRDRENRSQEKKRSQAAQAVTRAILLTRGLLSGYFRNIGNPLPAR